ncbi:MAG TPA: Crp/Fnr family transcriptional regulator [Chryseolinea sp.]|nr:Crp/Fnr family transcriptional regulator [Chryseolinea sp.]
MSMQGLFNVLSGFHALSDDFKKALEKEVVVVTLPKDESLLKVPKISSHAYFLEDGFAISYSYYEGRKVTENFWRPGQIIVSLASFFLQKPSLETIQLLRTSTLLCISFDSVMALMETYPEARRIALSVTIVHHEESRVRIRDLQHLSASQRFRRLIKEYPGIELIASQDAISTYLGITAQSMARMKRELE